jgi:hypothetical protein
MRFDRFDPIQAISEWAKITGQWSLGVSARQSTPRPMNRLPFFFSFELPYQRVPPKRRLGGVPEVGDQLLPKPLAVPAFIVQNGRALS